MPPLQWGPAWTGPVWYLRRTRLHALLYLRLSRTTLLREMRRLGSRLGLRTPMSEALAFRQGEANSPPPVTVKDARALPRAASGGRYAILDGPSCGALSAVHAIKGKP